MWKIYTIYVVFVALGVLLIKSCNGLCPSECHCTGQPKRCAPGVSLITDGCRCCTICARQENEWCDEENVCDTLRGLVCDYTDTTNGERGVCKVQSGRSCFYKGKSYVNGEMFRPSCKHQCWCMDKEVGCLSICPHETLVPKPDVCPGARLENVPGQCCKAWVCAGLDDAPKIDMERFWDELVDDDRDDDFSSAIIPQNDLTSLDSSTFELSNNDATVTPHMNDIARNNDLDLDSMGDGGPGGDDLLDYQIAFANHRRWAELGLDINDLENNDDYDNENYWEETNEFAGDDDARRRKKIRIKDGCKVQTSKWSDCSKACGLGVSTRVTNKNSRCAPRRESRLCQLRICDDKPTVATIKRGRKQCLKHKRPKKRQHFEYAGCKSTRSYKPRYCGKCDAHSCYPQSTKTVKIKFRCEGRSPFFKKMMWIKNCKCSAVTLFHKSYYNLFNDTAPTQPF